VAAIPSGVAATADAGTVPTGIKGSAEGGIRETAAPSGYHDKQAYVGGQLVWHTDVTYEDESWYSSSPINITADRRRGRPLRITRPAASSRIDNRLSIARVGRLRRDSSRTDETNRPFDASK
jgi:hypothetical protein